MTKHFRGILIGVVVVVNLLVQVVVFNASIFDAIIGLLLGVAVVHILISRRRDDWHREGDPAKRFLARASRHRVQPERGTVVIARACSQCGREEQHDEEGAPGWMSWPDNYLPPWGWAVEPNPPTVLCSAECTMQWLRYHVDLDRDFFSSEVGPMPDGTWLVVRPGEVRTWR